MTDDTLLGTFELVVLLSVARLAGEGYGVTLRAEIEERTGRDVSVGSVYATLARLEDKGFIASREGDPAPVRGGRARRLYRVLPEGLAAAEASRRTLAAMWDGVVG